ncbi:MAG: beta-ketoacyl synthase N-terminal-like domain-containing protein [Mycobacteriales bacterium]
MTAAPEPVAVVGIGCRLPGGVRDLAGLGALLRSGRTVIGEVPADRWGSEVRTSSHVGAFLDDIDRFDAAYFGISPREAGSLDPQQRLLLEVGWEAMADAGRPREAWRGSRTGVYAGMLAGDYATLHTKTLGLDGIGPHYASGIEFSFAAGRLAYAFDLHGPVATLNAACSSSLLAVHLASQALRLGECDTALAGGVNLLVSPELSVFMSTIGAISPTGRCRPFDVAADGVVRGEGCGWVVLRRLADAEADGDRVYAVIRGSAVNHGGASLGLTVPNAGAQAAVVGAALDAAGIDPAEVDYVEAHGTGTPLGDRIELTMLAERYGTVAGRPADTPPLLVGSHKAVFGHLDAAAGVTGLLKAISVLSSGEVPPQPVEELVPVLDWDTAGIAVRPDGGALPVAGARRPARAAVSAFGLSGTNVHLLLERPAAAPAPDAGRPAVLLASAPHADALAGQVEALRARLEATDHPGDLLASAATRRTHERFRYAEVLDGGLSCQGESPPDGAAAPVFVYSGQGSQWPGMAADLYDAVPEIRDTLDECDAAIRRHADWSLVDELRRTRGSRLNDTGVVQPALVAVQVAVTRWLARRRVTPSAVLGHSVGEIAAAHVAGCLSLEGALGLAVRRGAILHRTAGAGRMLAVHAPADAVRAAVDGVDVVVATENGPASVVLAGTPAAIAAATRACEARDLRCQPLAVDYAFHSPLVAHCGPELVAALSELDGVEAAPARLPFWSTVDPGSRLDRPDAGYWQRNVTEPVLLWPAMDALLREIDAPLVEIGPHPVLSRPLADAARRHGRPGPVVATLRRGAPGPAALLHALGRLHVAGVDVDWEPVTGRPARYRDLPVPSWGADRYWLPGVARGDQGRVTAPEPAATAGDPLPVVAEAPAPAPAGTARLAPRPATEVAEGVAGAVREVLALPEGQPLPRRRGLFELGLDSLTAVELRSRLEARYGVTLAATAVFEHPTVDELATHVAEQGAGGATADPAPEPEARPAPVPAPAPASGGRPVARDRAVAVIGVGCRLPGAASPAEYWDLLRSGRTAVTELPADRRTDPAWDADGVPTRGGFLDDVTGFDAAFFRIAPREARALDPQQRLMLEVSWEALEDAGLPARRLADRQVGVYVGLNTADYQQLLTRDMANVDLYYGTGTSFAATAGRLSYFLGLRGPAMAVDTACSASLTAVHLACQALRDGECEVAIVGGANAIVAPTVSVSMAAGGALAPDGRCKTFDEAADGYGRGEGAAAFVLKPLEAARRDGDRIYAVIAGTAVNSDGASGGLTVPNAAAQTAVIRAALARAGWQPGDPDYVEAHGTGTPLGDPLEVRALAEALGDGRDRPVLLGSVKANIGHLEAAAGAAGLLKVVLAVHHGEVPPHPIGTPSGRIGWDALPVELAGAVSPWPDRGRPRRAGVSAFGFTGSNAHVLVEQAPAAPAPPAPAAGAVLPYVLPVTAATGSALRAAAGRMAARVRACDPAELPDLVATATFRRSWLDHRAAVTGTTPDELAAALDAVAAGGELPAGARRGRVPAGEPVRITFRYGDDPPGEETRALLAAVPALAECASRLSALTGRNRDLAGPPPPGLEAAWVFAYQVAATRLWAGYGVRPDAVTGGVGADWAAGRLSLDAALDALAGGDRPRLGTAEIPVVDGSDGPVVDVLAPDLALALADLFVAGYEPAGGTGPRVPVSLPAYPWERRRYWYRDTDEPAPAAALPADDRLYTIGWVPVEPPEERPADPATWAVLGDGDLTEALEKYGHQVVPLTGGGDWRRRIEELATEHPDCQGVVAGPGTPLADALALGRAMAAVPRAPGRLWFVTRDDGPDESARWELGRVLAVELPGRWGGLVEADDPAAAVRALHAADPDDQYRVRDGEWHAARLRHAGEATPVREGVDPDRWHVVIGTPAGDAARALAALGARTLLVAGGDVDDLDGCVVERCELDSVGAALGDRPVGDVVVCATPVPTAALAGTDLPPLDRVVALARAAGALDARRVTVLASAGPAWGSVNTAAGAPAAGWLAGWARSAGAGLLAAMPRAGTGELRAEHEALFTESGLRLLTGEDVVAGLRRALCGPPGETHVAAVDLDTYVRICQDLAPRTFLDELAPAARTGTVRAELLARPEPAAAIRDHVGAVVAEVLGLDADGLDPDTGFFELGMDSVMALGLRSRLEADLGVELPSTLTFEYPDTTQLAAHVTGLLTEPAGGDDVPGDVLDDLDSAMALARRRLGDGEDGR